MSYFNVLKYYIYQMRLQTLWDQLLLLFLPIWTMYTPGQRHLMPYYSSCMPVTLPPTNIYLITSNKLDPLIWVAKVCEKYKFSLRSVRLCSCCLPFWPLYECISLFFNAGIRSHDLGVSPSPLKCINGCKM